MNREAILREMGITPIWKARTPVGEVTPALPDGVAAMPLEESDQALADPPVTPIRRVAPPVAERTVRASPTPSAPAAGVTVDPERVNQIARMEWPELKQAVAGCSACTLAGGRKNTVFGVGDEKADWMIIGEAPGAEEDARGEPFVGQAGRLLDAMLAALEMRREANIYIANVLKCRPPANRNPEPLEVAQCSPHLLRQVALIQPKLIILMGRFAAQTLLGTDASIASMRGRLHQYQGTPAIVTYHPAYLLRNLPDKAKAWQDLLFARATYRRLQSGAAAAQ